MAERKNSGGSWRRGKRNSRTMPVSAVFWIVFCIAVMGLFFYYAPEIQKNFSILSQSLNVPANTAAKPETPPQDKPEEPGGSPPPAAPPEEKPPAVPAEKPVSQKPPAAVNPPKTPPAPAEQKPPRPAEKPAAAKPAAVRDRSIYFTQVDNDGAVSRAAVSRTIPPSDSPMLDSLNALLTGPSAEEKRRGLVSLIPANTRILSLIVRGSTAYINLSEDFQYNTYGVEGYAAALKQIVWTATGFSNVKDVQILIENRRVDYLGEGIWIGSPIGRDSR
jgi:spore germination protein GerM